ncbi:MAG: preprotein translocase subunit SecG [Bacteroidales bacterium]|nr:preprotein translocase subunit SecG [Bacteroidales bacterium]
MYTAITVLIIIASILLTCVVLVQNSKGGGLAANFVSGNQTFGVRQTADFLEKATWTLAIIIIVLCILATAFISTHKSKNASESVVIEKMEQNANNAGVLDFSGAGNTESEQTENN